MNHRRHITAFVLTYFLLVSCISCQPTRSRRQKRGVLKMMMHIMWDPVRLIRYWYALDVTKEIAKSWRKIIPTILLLPVTQQNPHSHGFAKYVHPTFGVRDSNKKKVKHTNIPIVPYHQQATRNAKPVAVPMSISHQTLPSKHPPPHFPIQYYSSNELKSSADKKNNQPHVFVSHIPYKEDKSNNEYSVAQYFVADSNSREEMAISHVDFPNEDNRPEEDIRPLSSQKIQSNEYGENVHSYPSMIQGNYLHFLSQEGSETDTVRTENTQNAEISSVFDTGQEFHIVLHPIPVDDLSLGSLKHLSDGKAIHYVPIQLRSNDSFGLNFASAPNLVKAVTQNSSVSEDAGETRTDSSNDFNIIQYNLNSAKTNSSVGDPDVSFSDAKTQITWVPQKNASDTRRTDHKETASQSDESRKRIVSVHRNYLENLKLNKNSPDKLSINRNNINMEALREALKHGTPVFIPFNKNAHSSEIITSNDSKNTVRFPGSDYQSKIPQTDQRIPEDASKMLGEAHTHNNSSNEHSADRNSTQRLLLFLKKIQHLQTTPSK